MAALGSQVASKCPLRTIKEIQFGLLSPEEIKGMSVVRIEYPESMDEQKLRPKEKGLNDPKLGTIDRNLKCATCKESQAVCPGHFGHIELAVPVFHVGFIIKIKKLLETLCHNCGMILADYNHPDWKVALRLKDPKKRFDAIWRLSKTRKECVIDLPGDDEGNKKSASKIPHGGCGNRQPDSIKKEGLKLIANYKARKDDEESGKGDEKKEITPQDALNIFRILSDDTLAILGLNKDYARPEWMILTCLPVPPPPVRPSVSVDGTGAGMRGEDDLTYKLGDIIRANGRVEACIQQGSPQHALNEFIALLQYHVATFFDNDANGIPPSLQKSGRPLKTIRGRLKGKEGRLRGNLMGKRVDFSARTVITGDPNLSLDEVGVPRSIARTLTYPEIVTKFNIGKLSNTIRNGPSQHPGANYVIKSDGARLDLRHIKDLSNLRLQYGWKVERHLDDNDVIIFNRQPSLHKESMMGHRVRVMPYSTFRLNLSVTSPYNADFDGDEMNLHVPQSDETRSEIMNLCMVPLNIVSPQRNSPLMGIVQDTLCGVYKFCRRDVFVTKEQIMNIMMWVPEWDGIIPTPAIIKPRPRWTGKQIVSMIFPTGLNLSRLESGNKCPLNDEGLLISGGELMFGLLTKKIVGASAGGVIHIIFNEYGWQGAVAFFNGCQRLVNYWLLHHGFSIGIGDTIPDPATSQKIYDTVLEQKQKVEEITALATNNELEPLPGMSIRETFESKTSKELNTARDRAGDVAEKSLRDGNNAIQMARSGSKGSTINISQMTALVGQQSVEGKRIPFGFKYRSLPHFTKDDYSPEARGFVENSYLRGLTPTEFFFHAMAGREGLIDTAVKTAETGYIQRRLVKALEDVMVKYDGTVRNSLGDIVEFIYGEDGLDAVHIEKQIVDTIACSDAKFEQRFRVDVMGDTHPISPDVLELATEIKGDLEVQKELDQEWEQLLSDREFIRDGIDDDKEELALPLNIVRMIEAAKAKFRIKDGARSDLHPVEVITKVRELLGKLIIVRGDDNLSLEAQDSATKLFKCHLRSRLAFKRLVVEYSLNKLAFENVMGDLENRFLRAAVSPGEMVGVLAAQSIGEPATQMTLNTFHFAGVSSKNVTLGVPRLKEILNVAKNIKTPSMTVTQADPNGTQHQAKLLRSRIEHTTLRSLAESVELYYDPDIQNTVVEADVDMVESYFIIPEEDEDHERQSKWLLRIILDRKKLLDKSISIAEVAGKIKECFSPNIAVIFSDDNADQQVLRVRFVYDAGLKSEEEGGEKDRDERWMRKLEGHLLNEVTLRGISNVDRAFIRTEERIHLQEDGSIIKRKSDARCNEWILDTSGTNLRDVLSVEGVDPTRTYSNTFTEICEVFGIEAARAALLRELKAVLSFDGSYVNHRHLALLVDIMTARGVLMAITRHGINRADTGALMRCSFEETVEILLDAAGCGELDDCKGVSENIMLGQLAPMGTGEFDLVMDNAMLSTMVEDNSHLGVGAGAGSFMDQGAATPYDLGSPTYEGGGMGGGPSYDASFSPLAAAGGDDVGALSVYGGGYGEGSMSPGGLYATSPGGFAPTSPGYGTSPSSPGFSPSSPAGYSPTSPGMTSPRYGAATSPSWAVPTSPSYSPNTSPSFTPRTPGISPTSPGMSPTSPDYSPSSPTYSPTTPRVGGMGLTRPSATSPLAYIPTSPGFSPLSPKLDLGSDRRSPTSPTSPNLNYSPTSPLQGVYSPTSPKLELSPTSPAYGGSRSPMWSPKASPTSPKE